MVKKIAPKNVHDICTEWDNVCFRRHEAIEHGKDYSLFHVTIPCILNELKQLAPQRVLDVGCGTGYLTFLASNFAEQCVGIDISAKSIQIATSTYSNAKVSFHPSLISKYSPGILFDTCIANMVFSSDPDWKSSINSIHNLLVPNGNLLVMLPHPIFWAQYWDISNEPWFDYREEIYIEHNFSISFAKSLGQATYIHRPLSTYINEICSSGFSLESLIEPYPREPIPDGYRYDYPRFLFMRFKKN